MYYKKKETSFVPSYGHDKGHGFNSVLNVVIRSKWRIECSRN